MEGKPRRDFAFIYSFLRLLLLSASSVRLDFYITFDRFVSGWLEEDVVYLAGSSGGGCKTSLVQMGVVYNSGYLIRSLSLGLRCIIGWLFG